MVEDTAIDRTRPWAMAMPMRPTWPLVRASVQMAPAPMKHRANVPINSATHSLQAIRIADTSLGFAGWDPRERPRGVERPHRTRATLLCQCARGPGHALAPPHGSEDESASVWR